MQTLTAYYFSTSLPYLMVLYVFFWICMHSAVSKIGSQAMHFLTLIIKFCLTFKFHVVCEAALWATVYLADTHFPGLKIC